MTTERQRALTSTRQPPAVSSIKRARSCWTRIPEITEGTFTFEKWAKSANQLVDPALNTGLALVPAMIPYPCQPTSTESYGLSDSDRG